MAISNGNKQSFRTVSDKKIDSVSIFSLGPNVASSSASDYYAAELVNFEPGKGDEWIKRRGTELLKSPEWEFEGNDISFGNDITWDPTPDDVFLFDDNGTPRVYYLKNGVIFDINGESQRWFNYTEVYNWNFTPDLTAPDDEQLTKSTELHGILGENQPWKKVCGDGSLYNEAEGCPIGEPEKVFDNLYGATKLAPWLTNKLKKDEMKYSHFDNPYYAVWGIGTTLLYFPKNGAWQTTRSTNEQGDVVYTPTLNASTGTLNTLSTDSLQGKIWVEVPPEIVTTTEYQNLSRVNFLADRPGYRTTTFSPIATTLEKVSPETDGIGIAESILFKDRLEFNDPEPELSDKFEYSENKQEVVPVTHDSNRFYGIDKYMTIHKDQNAIQFEPLYTEYTGESVERKQKEVDDIITKYIKSDLTLNEFCKAENIKDLKTIKKLKLIIKENRDSISHLRRRVLATNGAGLRLEADPGSPYLFSRDQNFGNSSVHFISDLNLEIVHNEYNETIEDIGYDQKDSEEQELLNKINLSSEVEEKYETEREEIFDSSDPDVEAVVFETLKTKPYKKVESFIFDPLLEPQPQLKDQKVINFEKISTGTFPLIRKDTNILDFEYKTITVDTATVPKYIDATVGMSLVIQDRDTFSGTTKGRVLGEKTTEFIDLDLSDEGDFALGSQSNDMTAALQIGNGYKTGDMTRNFRPIGNEENVHNNLDISNFETGSFNGYIHNSIDRTSNILKTVISRYSNTFEYGKHIPGEKGIASYEYVTSPLPYIEMNPSSTAEVNGGGFGYSTKYIKYFTTSEYENIVTGRVEVSDNKYIVGNINTEWSSKGIETTRGLGFDSTTTYQSFVEIYDNDVTVPRETNGVPNTLRFYGRLPININPVLEDGTQSNIVSETFSTVDSLLTPDNKFVALHTTQSGDLILTLNDIDNVKNVFEFNPFTGDTSEPIENTTIAKFKTGLDVGLYNGTLGTGDGVQYTDMSNPGRGVRTYNPLNLGTLFTKVTKEFDVDSRWSDDIGMLRLVYADGKVIVQQKLTDSSLTESSSLYNDREFGVSEDRTSFVEMALIDLDEDNFKIETVDFVKLDLSTSQIWESNKDGISKLKDIGRSSQDIGFIEGVDLITNGEKIKLVTTHKSSDIDDDIQIPLETFGEVDTEEYIKNYGEQSALLRTKINNLTKVFPNWEWEIVTFGTTNPIESFVEEEVAFSIFDSLIFQTETYSTTFTNDGLLVYEQGLGRIINVDYENLEIEHKLRVFSLYGVLFLNALTLNIDVNYKKQTTSGIKEDGKYNLITHDVNFLSTFDTGIVIVFPGLPTENTKNNEYVLHTKPKLKMVQSFPEMYYSIYEYFYPGGTGYREYLGLCPSIISNLRLRNNQNIIAFDIFDFVGKIEAKIQGKTLDAGVFEYVINYSLKNVYGLSELDVDHDWDTEGVKVGVSFVETAIDFMNFDMFEYTQDEKNDIGGNYTVDHSLESYINASLPNVKHYVDYDHENQVYDYDSSIIMTSDTETEKPIYLHNNFNYYKTETLPKIESSIIIKDTLTDTLLYDSGKTSAILNLNGSTTINYNSILSYLNGIGRSGILNIGVDNIKAELYVEYVNGDERITINTGDYIDKVMYIIHSLLSQTPDDVEDYPTGKLDLTDIDNFYELVIYNKLGDSFFSDDVQIDLEIVFDYIQKLLGNSTSSYTIKKNAYYETTGLVTQFINDLSTAAYDEKIRNPMFMVVPSVKADYIGEPSGKMFDTNGEQIGFGSGMFNSREGVVSFQGIYDGSYIGKNAYNIFSEFFDLNTLGENQPFRVKGIVQETTNSEGETIEEVVNTFEDYWNYGIPIPTRDGNYEDYIHSTNGDRQLILNVTIPIESNIWVNSSEELACVISEKTGECRRSNQDGVEQLPDSDGNYAAEATIDYIDGFEPGMLWINPDNFGLIEQYITTKTISFATANVPSDYNTSMKRKNLLSPTSTTKAQIQSITPYDDKIVVAYEDSIYISEGSSPTKFIYTISSIPTYLGKILKVLPFENSLMAFFEKGYCTYVPSQTSGGSIVFGSPTNVTETANLIGSDSIAINAGFIDILTTEGVERIWSYSSTSTIIPDLTSQRLSSIISNVFVRDIAKAQEHRVLSFENLTVVYLKIPNLDVNTQDEVKFINRWYIYDNNADFVIKSTNKKWYVWEGDVLDIKNILTVKDLEGNVRTIFSRASSTDILQLGYTKRVNSDNTTNNVLGTGTRYQIVEQTGHLDRARRIKGENSDYFIGDKITSKMVTNPLAASALFDMKWKTYTIELNNYGIPQTYKRIHYVNNDDTGTFTTDEGTLAKSEYNIIFKNGYWEVEQNKDANFGKAALGAGANLNTKALFAGTKLDDDVQVNGSYPTLFTRDGTSNVDENIVKDKVALGSSKGSQFKVHLEHDEDNPFAFKRIKMTLKMKKQKN